MKKMLKIGAMSDLHGLLPKDTEEVDVYCICGDVLPLRMQRNIEQSFSWMKKEFLPYLQSLPCKKVFLIGGNHDFLLDPRYSNRVEDFKEEVKKYDKVVYLMDEEYEWKGWKIYGSPWIKTLRNWAFYTENTSLKFSSIPSTVDVLLLHQPPMVGDLGTSLPDRPYKESRNYGDRNLIPVLDRINSVVFCGHVHTGRHLGVSYRGNSIYNVSLLNEDYVREYDVTYVEIEKEIEGD